MRRRSSSLLNSHAFVILFPPLRQSDFDFCPPSFIEEKLDGDQRESFVRESSLEAFELLVMEKELARAPFGGVDVSSLFIRGDIHIEKVQLSLFEGAKGILKLPASSSERFHLWSC